MSAWRRAGIRSRSGWVSLLAWNKRIERTFTSMWEAFKNAIFYCIEFFYNFLQDWGLAIVIVTLILRLILFPLMQKQIKSSYRMQQFSPRLREIQEKYADDQQRQAEEMQKVYAEIGFNPITGCLPLFLQMPIFIALYQVLQEMGSRTEGMTYSFYNILPNLVTSPSTAFSEGFMVFLPYGILLLLFAFCTFLPSILQQRGTNNPQKNQTMIMMGVMSLFMLWLGWGSPTGVILFWATSSVFGVAQQVISTAVFKRQDEVVEAEKVEVAPVEVDVVRKEKKKRPTKKR